MEDALREWLLNKRNAEAPACVFGAVGLFLLAVVVSAVTGYLYFCLFYLGWFGIAALCELTLGCSLPKWPTRGIACFTVLFLLLLFIENARTRWWEIGDIPKGNWRWGTRRDDAEAFAGIRATAKFVTDLCFTGPKLLTASWRTFRKALRLRRLDVDGCSRLLHLLLTAARAVPRTELALQGGESSLPDLERQLEDIGGVVCLEHAVSLTEELRSELIHKIRPTSSLMREP